MPSIPENVTHIGFADESKHNIGRYRSISLVSLSVEHFNLFNKLLNDILTKRKCTEIKWQELRTNFDLKVTEEIFGVVYEYARLGLIRCDTLIWDIEDSRHKIRSRDDVANLIRMYYHLLKNVLINRWPDNSTWAIYPDENSSIDWDNLKDVLDAQSISLKPTPVLRTLKAFGLAIRREFRIEEMVEKCSHDEPLIQVADIFAGASAYSRDCFERYKRWCDSLNPQETLFEEDKVEPLILTGSEKRRFEFLKNLKEFSRKHKLGISLESSGGLKTFHPKYPMNFWWYVPQTDLDKAPTSA